MKIDKDNDERKGESDPYLQKARMIANEIKFKTIGNSQNWDMNTIQQVLEQSIELSGEEFISITLKNRLQRRILMEKLDINGYQQLVMKYNDDIEEILKKAQETILQISNIDSDDFEQSVVGQMEQGHFQEIYMFQAAIRQKLKEKIKSSKNLVVKLIKDIINFQLKIVTQQPELIKKVLTNLSTSPETLQLIPSIFNTLLNDYIYQEFKIEEEDQMQCLTRSEVVNDPEIIALIQKVEQEMYNIMNFFDPTMELY